MKIIASHEYKNGKVICAGYLTKAEQRKYAIDSCDFLALCFMDGEEYHRVICIRPDEAITIIQVLAEAMGKTIKAYES